MNHSLAENNGANPQIAVYTTSVEELAQAHGFKRIGNEWHGANPKGGATKDGYILNDDGTSFDRKLNQRFTSSETAQNFSIAPAQYEPIAFYQKQNGRSQRVTRAASAPTLSVNAKAKPRSKPRPTRSTTYDYTKDGKLLFQAVRREYADSSKDFTQRRPDGRGQWIYNLKDVATVLYHADDVQAAQTVILCEGEKALDAVNTWLKSADLYGEIVATTNPMGADKWRDSYSDALIGKHVIGLPDNDTPSRRHFEKVVQSLTGKAASIKVVELPGLPEKGEVVSTSPAAKPLKIFWPQLMPRPNTRRRKRALRWSPLRNYYSAPIRPG